MRARGFALFGLVGLICSLAAAAHCQAAYPSWFLSPPAGDTVSVFADSEPSAIASGANMLAAYGKSIVWGDFQNFFDSSIDSRSFTNTDYYYYYDQAEADRQRRLLAVADAAVVAVFPSAKVYLVAPEGGLPGLSREIVTVADLPRPSWAAKIGYFEGDRIYGVGRFTLDAAIPQAWVKAEENAIYNLLTVQSAKIGVITKVDSSDSGDSMEQIQWVRLRYGLSGLRVERRWVDVGSNLCMVLVSAPQSSVRSIK